MPVDPQTAELAGKANPRLELESSPVTLPFFPAMLHDMWDLSSLTGDWTCSPWSGSMKSESLDHQGSPKALAFLLVFPL